MTALPVAVVTGTAHGIGRCTAELLATHNYRVVLCDVGSSAATQTAIQRAGGEAFEVLGDLTDASTVRRLVATVNEHFGRIDVLVNNAGVSLIRPAELTRLEDLRRVLEVNVVAPFVLSQAFGTMMLAQRSGSIINVASIAGLFGVADRAAYNVSKHGLVGLTRTLAAEWGGYGVRINAVCPGWVKTEMDVADQAGGNYRDADIIARVPMGRFAVPADVAAAILFLSSSQTSGFITGQTIVVDGGWSADGGWDELRRMHRPGNAES